MANNSSLPGTPLKPISSTPAKDPSQAQYFGVLLDQSQSDNLDPESLIFNDIVDASKFLKQNKGSRMKSFRSRDLALEFINKPRNSANDSICSDLSASFERLSVKPEETEKFSSPTPSGLTQIRKAIEAGNGDEVERLIWENPRSLVTVCDSAVYLMAGPKYNACHIAARANKPEMIALILETVSNYSFMRKLYPQESEQNIRDRVNHLLDSYLNTPDPRLGNTPLQFACKLGHHRVVKVLLSYEKCDLNLKDLNGKSAEENICCQAREAGDGTSTYKKIKNMFKAPLHSPYRKDQLKKRLLMDKRLNKSDSALIL